MPDLHDWKQLFCQPATPICTLADFHGVKISVKRDDLNHPIVQGNKLRKLKYNVLYALLNHQPVMATFGGAFSNHILATAQAAALCNIHAIGFIRGDELPAQPHLWSPTLQQAKQLGMDLVFLNRADYRLKQQSTVVQSHLNTQQINAHLVPEGGTNALALKGVMEIIAEVQQQISRQSHQPTHILTACGTAGTMAGLIAGVAKAEWNTQVIGIPVLKNGLFLQQNIIQLITDKTAKNWQLYDNYHCGGYAKGNQELAEFGRDFVTQTGIDLDKVYTAKAFFAAYDLIKKQQIPANSHLLIVHTGGLQGGSILGACPRI